MGCKHCGYEGDVEHDIRYCRDVLAGKLRESGQMLDDADVDCKEYARRCGAAEAALAATVEKLRPALSLLKGVTALPFRYDLTNHCLYDARGYLFGQIDDPQNAEIIVVAVNTLAALDSDGGGPSK